MRAMILTLGTEKHTYEKQVADMQTHRVTMKVNPLKKTMVPLVVVDRQSVDSTSKCCGHVITTMYEHLEKDKDERTVQYTGLLSIILCENRHSKHCYCGRISME